MTVKEFIKLLETSCVQDKEIMVACDEEWNTIFKDIKIQESESDPEAYVIFGLSGSETE